MSTGYAMAEESQPMAYKEQPKKTKKPGFLDRWLFKRLQNGAAYEQKQKQEQESINMKSASLSIGQSQVSKIDNHDKSIRFTIHPANGGRVIETQRYDRQKDRHSNGLYVITNDQDFGREIDKIITMESLK